MYPETKRNPVQAGTSARRRPDDAQPEFNTFFAGWCQKYSRGNSVGFSTKFSWKTRLSL